MAIVIATDGGPHSPETYAMAMAEHLFQIDPAVSGDRRLAAKRLQLAIADALIPHHTTVRDVEVSGLATDPHGMLGQAHAHDEHVEAGLQAIVGAAAGTPWAAHFAEDQVQAVVREELAKIWRTAAEEEREWWAHRNPDSEPGQAFLARARDVPVHVAMAPPETASAQTASEEV